MAHSGDVVIPIHDRNPTRRTPVVTYALIAANTVAFLLSPVARSVFTGSGAAESCREQRFYLRWGAVPTELVHDHALPYTAGAAAGPGLCERVARTYDKIPALSALTSMFVHGGWLHLLGNMLFLWVFGNNVEDRFGRVRFLIFYLAVGMASAYGYALTRPGSTSTLVGASGAIAGVLGAYLVLYPAGQGDQPGADLLLHPASAAGLAGAGELVPAAGVLRRRVGRLRWRRRLPGARRRVPARSRRRSARAVVVEVVAPPPRTTGLSVDQVTQEPAGAGEELTPVAHQTQVVVRRRGDSLVTELQQSGVRKRRQHRRMRRHDDL